MVVHLDVLDCETTGERVTKGEEVVFIPDMYVLDFKLNTSEKPS